MADKLGLLAYNAATDDLLIGELLELLQQETDMTIFFRNLGRITSETKDNNGQMPAQLFDAYYQPHQLTDDYRRKMTGWLQAYRRRLQQDRQADETRRVKMNSVNPKYVLRNYLAQMAIDQAEAGDFSLVNELLDLLRHPYDEQPEREKFAARRPEWARHRAGCSMLSCSS